MVSHVVFIIYRIALFSACTFLSISYFISVLYNYVSKPDIDNLYDYIIVGGGTAGTVLAGRLARDQGVSVLLLEAGPAPPAWDLLGLMNIPVMSPLWQQSNLDWAYTTSPQEEACDGLTDRVGDLKFLRDFKFVELVSRWPRGRILGGTARLNNLIYLRGHYYDWDEWEKFGGPDWSRKRMFHYLRKSERQLGSYVNDTAYHKTSGWLPVTDSPLTALGRAVLDGVREMGFPVRDLNGAFHEGFMRTQITTLHGSRFSPDRAFVLGDLDNLSILTHSHVNKVLLNERSEAIGVEFRRSGKTLRAKSRRGVILSAGTIGSPQILFHSGIGPAQVLKALQIPVYADLPVGENLQDHVIIGLDLVLLNTTLAVNLANLFHPESVYHYVVEGKGPWTHAGCEVVGVWRSNRINGTKAPDLQMMVLPAGVASDGGAKIRHNLGISDKVWERYFEPLTRRTDITSVTLGIVLLHPLSRGSLTVNTPDPWDPPIIDPNYLQDPEDVETLIEGIDMLRRLLRTKAMNRLGASINPRKVPGCKALPFFSRRYWDCYIRSLTFTAFHPVGTCRMGSVEDKTTVVDSTLRVHGVHKLYVADASVMPTLPSANPMAAVIAIAEKMADILQKERELGLDGNLSSFFEEQEAAKPRKAPLRQPNERNSDEL